MIRGSEGIGTTAGIRRRITEWTRRPMPRNAPGAAGHQHRRAAHRRAHGGKRPPHTVANARHIGTLTTGETEESCADPTKHPGGKTGGRPPTDFATPEHS